MAKLDAISRLGPVPQHHHMNAARFCWTLCALLALRGQFEKRNNQRNAVAGYNMVTSKRDACLAGPFMLARLRCHGHHQCIRQESALHVARLATRTSLTSRGAMLLMRFALVPFVAKPVIRKSRYVRLCAQYVVPHSDFGCWPAQVLLVFTRWSAVWMRSDAEQGSGTVASCRRKKKKSFTNWFHYSNRAICKSCLG